MTGRGRGGGGRGFAAGAELTLQQPGQAESVSGAELLGERIREHVTVHSVAAAYHEDLVKELQQIEVLPSEAALPLQTGAQRQHGLRVTLANARLRQIEDLRDLDQAHVLEVVHGKDLSGYIGQLLDSLSDKLEQFVVLHAVAG